jgi:hypothetical protein
LSGIDSDSDQAGNREEHSQGAYRSLSSADLITVAEVKPRLRRKK